MSTVHSHSRHRTRSRRTTQGAVREAAQAPTTAAVSASLLAGVPAPAGQETGTSTVRRRWAAFARGFVYAGRGLGYALRTQRNMRVHLLLAALAIALGIALRISAVEFALVFIAIMLVFGTEMLNTVVETIVDMVTPEYHPLARVAKDVAAGAVLLNAILAVIIALFVFVPHVWRLLGG